MDKMISVLIPTRGRIKEVIKVVANLYGTAKYKKNIEILIRIDDDDEESCLAVKSLPDYVDVIVGPRYRGYLDMHQYVNELCELAQGDLYLLWNDDVYMETEGWDVIYAEEMGDAEYACVQLSSGTQFPAITPALYNLLGHFSRHCANDSYIEFAVQGTGIEKRVDIEVNHLHEEMEDKTRDDFRAIAKDQHADFWSPRMQEYIRKDRMKILKTVKPPLPITAYVSGKNGGEFLHRCLSSLWFCDQIIYLDDSSTDGSWSIAKEYATDLYRWYGPDSMAQRRNYAIGYTGEEDYVPYWVNHQTMKKSVPLVKNEWLLYIDDDEELVQGDNLPDLYSEFNKFTLGQCKTLKKEDDAAFLLLMNVADGKRPEIQTQAPLMRMFRRGTVSWRKDAQNKTKHGDKVGLMPVRLKHYGYGDNEYKFKKLWNRVHHLENDVIETPTDISRLNYLINNLSSYAQNNNHLERVYALYEAIKRVFLSHKDRERSDMKTTLFVSTRSLWKCFFKNNYIDQFISSIDEVYIYLKDIPDVNYWLAIASSKKGNIDAIIEYGEAYFKSRDKFMRNKKMTNIELEHMTNTAQMSRVVADCYCEKSLDPEVYGKKKKYLTNKSKKYDKKFREAV